MGYARLSTVWTNRRVSWTHLGGRWKTIQDYGHTEYRMPGLKKTPEMAYQLINESQLQTHAIISQP